jgi:hypothetical protein
MKTTEQLDEARLGMIDFFKKEGMLDIEDMQKIMDANEKFIKGLMGEK